MFSLIIISVFFLFFGRFLFGRVYFAVLFFTALQNMPPCVPGCGAECGWEVVDSAAAAVAVCHRASPFAQRDIYSKILVIKRAQKYIYIHI